jgi:hypothetical protein
MGYRDSAAAVILAGVGERGAWMSHTAGLGSATVGAMEKGVCTKPKWVV